MGNRLTQIATRTGDNGKTGLADNTRLDKFDDRIVTMGDVDELNSHIGLLLCEPLPPAVNDLLVEVQHQLFNLSSCIAMPGYDALQPEAVAALDQALEEHNAKLPRLLEFILPGGSKAAAQAHVCRTIARRAERSLVRLNTQHPQRPELGQYLNRLSDLMFVLARVLNRVDGGDDVYWRSERLRREQREVPSQNDDAS